MEPSVPDHPPDYPPVHPRTCVLCGSDCSTVPHLRDSRGRYACSECVRLERQRRADTGAGAAPPRPPPAPDAGHALAEASDDASSPIPLAPAPPPPTADFLCPVCIIRMPPDLGRCVQCGYDPRKGIQTSRKFRKMRTKEGARRPVCAKCGYDMTGVPGTRCPECGTVADFARRRYDRAESRRIARWSYLKPAIMFAVGVSGVGLELLITGDAAAIPWYLLSYLISVPVGVFAFCLCGWLWIGFDAPLHRVALSLAGVYAIVDLICVLASLIPILILPWLIVGIAYVALIADALDLDSTDAFGVAVATFIVRSALMIFLLAWVFNVL